ncbi:MAG: diguanylate cyclase [Proteobacteria bacterium]|nr:diguanylate cyclase [Pseudomonadota bacterium]
MSALPAFALDPSKPFEQYVAHHWSIQDGLPQISVMAIAQDNDGYLWVGTQDGLARFDGVHFTTYTPESEPALPGIWIRALTTDRHGRVWIGTYKGLASYAGGHFSTYRLPGADARRELDVFAIATDAKDEVYAATDQGVLRVAGDGLVRTSIAFAPALSLLIRSDGQWIGGKSAVLHVQGGKSENLPLPGDAANIAVTRLVEAQGRLWAGTSQGLYYLQSGAWIKLDDPRLDNSPIGALYEDRDGNLWVGTNAALVRIRDGQVVESYAGNPRDNYRNVISAYEDREGDLWLGSQVEGVIRVWNGWTRRYSTAYGLNDPVVWSLSRGPDGTVWVGTSNGLSVLDHGRFRTVLEGSRLPHPHAYNLLAERDRVWIGTRHGLAVLNADGSVETSQLFAPMAGAQINGIVRGPDGALWFPTTDGLFRLEHEGQPDAHLRRYGPADGLGDPRVRAMLWQRDGRLLVGTQSGLFVMQGERFVPIGVDAGLPPGLDITALYQFPGGELAVGTMAEQMYVHGSGRWLSLGPEQGLPHNATFFMTVGDRGYLWIAGIRGIERLPVADILAVAHGHASHVRGEMILNERGDRDAGQQGYCCNGAGMSKGYIEDGHVLWLPSRDGVVALDTHGIVKNPVPPIPVIERVDTRDGSFTPATLPAMLAADQRDLGFEFTAPSFQDPHSVQIRYRLRGYDTEWHDFTETGQRRANYTNLPPRAYVFEVMAANNAGLWNPTPARLSFAIRPHFHETHLFDALIALLILAIFSGGYHHQRQKHEAQRVALERMVVERTEQLNVSNARLENASQSDPATGLRNRRYLANQIPADLAFYDREQQREGKLDQAMLFVLVRLARRDRDAPGAESPPIGDRSMQQIAQVLGALVRAGDYLARWDQAEILLILRPMGSRHIDVIGERILGAIRNHAFDGDGGAPLSLGCAVGIAEFPLYRDALRRPGWEQVVGLARAAMLWAARQGTHAWSAFRPTLRSDLGNLVNEMGDDPQPLIDNGRMQVLGAHTPGDGDAGANRR